MNCVSYTRITPELSDLPSIEEQNATIRQFAKSLGMNIEKRYTDRKTTEGSLEFFQKMKEDAVSRRFQCVVFHSYKIFGSNIFIIHDLLGQLFLPAGIQFAFAVENFYSGSVTDTEAKAFIEEKYHRGIIDYRLDALKTHLSERKYEKYGYLYADEGMNLVIDPNTAPLVKEIFELFDKGKRPVEIAKMMTERGELIPTSYNKRKTNPDFIPVSTSWKYPMIISILRKELYCGVWKRNLIGTVETYPCPAIIDRELFDRVQVSLDNRKNGYKKPGFAEILFSRAVFDKETGAPLVAQIHQPASGPVMRIPSRLEHGIDYEKKRISVEEMKKSTRQFLANEKAQAVSFQKMLSSLSGQHLKNSMLQALSREKRKIIEEMICLAELYFPIQSSDDYAGDGVDQRIIELDDRMEMLEAQLSEIKKSIADMEIALSEKNPWLKLFLTYDGRCALDRSIIKKYISKILCNRFESLEIIPKELRWKEIIPKAFMEVS